MGMLISSEIAIKSQLQYELIKLLAALFYKRRGRKTLEEANKEKKARILRR